MAENTKSEKAPAIPQQWIVPLRLLIYVVIAGCSAYVYFNYRDLETTHMLILLPIVHRIKNSRFSKLLLKGGHSKHDILSMPRDFLLMR